MDANIHISNDQAYGLAKQNDFISRLKLELVENDRQYYLGLLDDDGANRIHAIVKAIDYITQNYNITRKVGG